VEQFILEETWRASQERSEATSCPDLATLHARSNLRQTFFRFARRHYTEVCRLLVVAICYVLVVAICYMLVVAIYYVYASLSGVSCSHMLLVSTCYVLVCHLLWVLTVS